MAGIEEGLHDRIGLRNPLMAEEVARSIDAARSKEEKQTLKEGLLLGSATLTAGYALRNRVPLLGNILGVTGLLIMAKRVCCYVSNKYTREGDDLFRARLDDTQSQSLFLESEKRYDLRI